MSIVSGYKKFKKYILTSSGFQLVSHWTKANTLEFDDGKTAQAKLGAIDGISSSRESNSDKIAASTALVSELNSDLGGCSFLQNDDQFFIIGDNGNELQLGGSFKVQKIILNSGDVKSYTTRYADLTTDNFAIEVTNVSLYTGSYSGELHKSAASNISLTYNPSTGILSTSGSHQVGIGDASATATTRLCMFIPASWLDKI